MMSKNILKNTKPKKKVLVLTFHGEQIDTIVSDGIRREAEKITNYYVFRKC